MSQLPSSGDPGSRIGCNSPEMINADAWNAYGRHHIQRDTQLTDVEKIRWGPSGTGPGDEILSDLRGRRVLDLGCGPARHAAHLARDLGAVVDAVDSSPTQIQRARDHYGDLPGLRLIVADAADYLSSAVPYDLIYAINAVPFYRPAPAAARPGPGAQARRSSVLHRPAHQLQRPRPHHRSGPATGNAPARRRRRPDSPHVGAHPPSCGRTS